MVSQRRTIFQLFFATTLIGICVYSTALADVITETIGVIVGQLNDVFRKVDIAAVSRMATKRDELPNAIASYTTQIQPILLKEVGEIQTNIDEHKQITGATTGVPIWPTSDQMMSNVHPLVDATYDLSFQALRADGLTPYMAEIDHVVKELGDYIKSQEGNNNGQETPTPTPTATPTSRPCVTCLRVEVGVDKILAMGGGGGGTGPTPPTASLIKAMTLLETDAAKIRAGAKSIGRYSVASASSPLPIIDNIKSVQVKLQSVRGQHTIVDGAVEGLITGLDRVLERTQDMTTHLDADNRYDYFNQGYADDLVNKANQLLTTNSTEALDAEADFLGFLHGELGLALKSIVLKEGDVPGMMAYQISKELIPKVAERIASAQSAVVGLASKAATAKQAAEKFWFEFFRHKCRHCFHEDIAANAIFPIYDMAAEFKNLSSPQYLLSQLNINVFEDLQFVLDLDKTVILPDTQTKVQKLADSASKAVAKLLPQGSPSPSVIQMQFTGACGEYAPDPNTSAFNFISPEEMGKNIQDVNNSAKKLSRELQRREKNGSVVCAPTDSKCKKKAQKAAKALKLAKAVTAKTNKRLKGILKDLPAQLNKAYKAAYGKFPYQPFK